MPVGEVRQGLLSVFARWGKPGAMRVDNGVPLGSPNGQAAPVLALWLIAHDVDMIWSRPACPQQNGRVEKMQHTAARWAEIGRAMDCADLQRRLDAALVLQRQHYPVCRLQKRTRLQAFPQLETSRRVYDPGGFDVQRAHRFLAGKLYTRKVSACGTIVHYGQVYCVGRPYGQKWVQLRLTKDGQNWQVLADYKVVKTLPAPMLSAESIQSLTLFQRTNDST